MRETDDARALFALLRQFAERLKKAELEEWERDLLIDELETLAHRLKENNHGTE